MNQKSHRAVSTQPSHRSRRNDGARDSMLRSADVRVIELVSGCAVPVRHCFQANPAQLPGNYRAACPDPGLAQTAVRSSSSLDLATRRCTLGIHACRESALDGTGPPLVSGGSKRNGRMHTAVENRQLRVQQGMSPLSNHSFSLGDHISKATESCSTLTAAESRVRNTVVSTAVESSTATRN